MRLSIEITSEQHQRLKAVAALQGKTIKDYVLERSLPDINTSENKALKQLEDFLKPRIEAAENSAFSEKSVDDIFDEVIEEENGKK